MAGVLVGQVGYYDGEGEVEEEDERTVELLKLDIYK